MELMSTLVRRSRLRWYGHVFRRNKEAGVRRALEFEVEGMAGKGRPRLGLREQVEKDGSESVFTGC